MALHFVSTSVLSSSDGIDFNSETQKETEESRAARLRAEAAAAKPLYMQLAEREDEKKQEYDAMTKKLFAPPKALDEEDAAHLSRLDEARDKTLKQREHAEKAALATFRSNRLQDISAKVSHPLIAIPAKKETHNVAPAAVVIKTKRKRIDQVATLPAKHAVVISAAAEAFVDTKGAPAAGISSLLSYYGSDSDEG